MILATERLILRPWEARDTAPYAAMMGDPHVRRFYPTTMTAEETAADMERHRESLREEGLAMCTAELRDGGDLVGLIGICRIPACAGCAAGRTRGRDRLGVRSTFLGPRPRPRGCYRLARLRLGDVGLPDLVAFTSRINTPSRRAMEKLGVRRDPADDFMHPRIAEGHPLREHVLYRIGNPRLS